LQQRTEKECESDQSPAGNPETEKKKKKLIIPKYNVNQMNLISVFY
jgi:hypothetical protein